MCVLRYQYNSGQDEMQVQFSLQRGHRSTVKEIQVQGSFFFLDYAQYRQKHELRVLQNRNEKFLTVNGCSQWNATMLSCLHKRLLCWHANIANIQRALNFFLFWQCKYDGIFPLTSILWYGISCCNTQPPSESSHLFFTAKCYWSLYFGLCSSFCAYLL